MGFGGGFGGSGRGRGGPKRGKAGGGASDVRVAVFKARLSYAWDGDTVVARQLEATSFGETDTAQPTATIRGVGEGTIVLFDTDRRFGEL